MLQRGVWWKMVVCASALAGCLSRSELDPDPDGEPGYAGKHASGGGGKAGHGGSPGSGAKAGRGGGPSAGSGGKATAGQGPTGGRGGSDGTGEACSSAPACGGDITGTWTVISSCLDVTGVMDVRPIGLGCDSALITGSRAVAGTFTANADGTYLDRTTTSGEDQIELAAACLNISGTIVMCERVAPAVAAYGYDSVTCTPASDGTCVCDAAFARAAGLGTLSFDPLANGSFTTSGSILTLDDEVNVPTSYQYCASASELTLLPLPSFTGTLRGAVVLASQ